MMKAFVIHDDHRVIAYLPEELPASLEPGAVAFHNEAEFEALAANWPGTRLVSIWNNLAGVVPVRKFTDRRAALRRIWKAVQSLAPVAAPVEKPTAESKPRAAREHSKKAQVLEMLARPEGATVKEIMTATCWQAHTVRGFLSGTVGRRLGLPVTSDRRPNGDRAYRLTRGTGANERH